MLDSCKMIQKQSEAFHTFLLHFSKFKTEFYFISSSHPDCIFEVHQLWQSGFSKVYSNCCCSCSFEPGIIEIGLSSHKMYSNNILSFKCVYQKKSGNLLKAPHTHTHTYIYIYIYIYFIWSKVRSFQHEWNAHRTTIPVWLRNTRKRLI